MSASSKKKLRKEQNAAALTEKQRAEQKEAKKLKAYSISFIAIMLVVVITAASVMTVTGINRSGIFQKNTIAAVVGDRQVNTVELTYYLKDAMSVTYQDWYNEYGDYTGTYLSLLYGLDITKPLNEQDYSEELTWADYFMDIALKNLQSDYALCQLAEQNGFKMSESDTKGIETNLRTMELYAEIYGFRNLDKYLESLYIFGASEKSYTEYFERSALAQAYYNHIYDSKTYDEEAIRAYEKDKFDNYSSFSFALYTLNYSTYLTGGTKDEEGNTTYSDDDIAAALALAEADAKTLSSATDLEKLNAAIKALKVNEGKTVSATENDMSLFTSISSEYRDWLASKDRKSNDITYIAKTTTTTDEDGKEVKETTGYYVVLFQERNDNLRALANVRHLLVKFEGGKTENGKTTYSDAEKAAAKAEAEGYLKTWKEGAATEESFIELVKKHSDDSSKDSGGLFEDITPVSSYVENFLNWSIDSARKTGDTDVIETEYGYHVMYYVGDSDISYRDHMITNDMRAEDMEKWMEEILKPVSASFKDLSRMEKDFKITG